MNFAQNFNFNSSSLDLFIHFLTNLDVETKKILVSKLSASIEEKSKIEKSNFSSLFGSWVDNRSSDEIISDIKLSRTNNDKNIDF